MRAAEERRISLRIGMNFGDIIIEDGRRSLRGRRERRRSPGEIADPGGIAISGKVYEELQGKVELASRTEASRAQECRPTGEGVRTGGSALAESRSQSPSRCPISPPSRFCRSRT